jgi:hypothetical protein
MRARILELVTGVKKLLWEEHGFGKGTASAVPPSAPKDVGFNP